MPTYISRREWESTRPWTADRVAIDALRVVANASYDAFGRKKSQPVDVDVTLSLEQPMSSAAATDALDTSTVHYGDLSKTVMQAVQVRAGDWQQPHGLLVYLAENILQFAQSRSTIASLSLSLRFPKSSLASPYGWGLSFNHNLALNAICLEYELRRFEVPVLIGVNSHERLMKQKTVFDLTIDRLVPDIANECYQVEQILSKTVEESSFETLEALVEAVAANVIKFFLLAIKPSAMHFPQLPEPAGIRVRASKPLAVPFANAAVVEVYRTADGEGAFGKKILSELGSKRPQIPFPLQGRLDEFLQSWKQD